MAGDPTEPSWRDGLVNAPTARRLSLTMPSTNVPLNDLGVVLRCLQNPPKKVDWLGSLTSMASSVVLIAKAINDMAGKFSPLNIGFLMLGTLLLGVQGAALWGKARARDVHHDAAVATVEELIALHKDQQVTAQSEAITRGRTLAGVD